MSKKIQSNLASFGKNKEMFVLATEHDTAWHESSGAIIMETYVNKTAKHNIHENAKRFGNKYGQKHVFALVYVGTYEEFANQNNEGE